MDFSFMLIFAVWCGHGASCDWTRWSGSGGAMGSGSLGVGFSGSDVSAASVSYRTRFTVSRAWR